MKTSNKNEEDISECFGNLEKVFPMGVDGLRKTPESCMKCCDLKTECLRRAMTGSSKGFKAREKYVDRAYESGMIGFFERWSRKKYFNRHANSKKK